MSVDAQAETKRAERREKQAFQKLDLARATATTGTRTLVVTGLSLLLLWCQVVAPTIADLVGVARARERYAVLSQSVRPLQDLFQPLSSESTTAQRKYEAELNKARQVPVKIGTVDLGTIPVFFVPLIWSGAWIIVALYLANSRKRTITLLARGVRSLKTDTGYSRNQIVDIAPALPHWILPLPAKRGRAVTPAELYLAAGWIAGRRRAQRMTTAVFVAAVGLQVATLLTAFATSSLASSAIARFVSIEFTALLLVATLACVCNWLRETRVPDYTPSNDDPNRLRRRYVLMSAAAAAAVTAVLPVFNLAISYQRLAGSRKNWRKGRGVSGFMPPPNTIESGLLNSRTGVVHSTAKAVAGSYPCLRTLAAPTVNRLTPVSYGAVLLRTITNAVAVAVPTGPVTAGIQMRVDRGHASWAVEREANRLVASEKPDVDRACRVLLQGISITPNSLRLYDYLAGLTVRHNLPHYRQALLKTAEARLQVENRLRPSENPMRDWILRALGLKRSDPVRQRKRRSRCGAARGKRYESVGDFAVLLKARMERWQTTDSRWYKEWMDPKRRWDAPNLKPPCA